MLIDDPDSASGKRVIADNPACMAPDGGECCPQYHKLLTALRRIDGINDNPACFNVEIEAVLRAALDNIGD